MQIGGRPPVRILRSHGVCNDPYAMAVETDRNAELLRSFVKMPRRVPRPPATGGFSILLVKRGPYGPYRALYSHERHLFFAATAAPRMPGAPG